MSVFALYMFNVDFFLCKFYVFLQLAICGVLAVCQCKWPMLHLCCITSIFIIITNFICYYIHCMYISFVWSCFESHSSKTWDNLAQMFPLTVDYKHKIKRNDSCAFDRLLTKNLTDGKAVVRDYYVILLTFRITIKQKGLDLAQIIRAYNINVSKEITKRMSYHGSKSNRRKNPCLNFILQRLN